VADTPKRIDLQAVANRIKERRRSRGMNQTELAERADVSQATISQIENNERRPGLEALDAIACALDEPLEFLLNGIRSPEAEEIPANVQVAFRDFQRLNPSDLAIVQHHMSLLRRRPNPDDNEPSDDG